MALVSLSGSTTADESIDSVRDLVIALVSASDRDNDSVSDLVMALVSLSGSTTADESIDSVKVNP